MTDTPHTWDTDWAALDGLAWAEVLGGTRVPDLFAAALGERLYAAGLAQQATQFAQTLATLQAAPSAGTAAVAWWYGFYTTVNGLRITFVRSDRQYSSFDPGANAPTSTPTTPVTFAVGDGVPQPWGELTISFSADLTIKAGYDGPWPPPDGYTRKFRRHIWSTANAGVEGQRARFTYWNGSTWWGDPAGPDFGNVVTTPPEQRGNACSFFDFKDGAWQLSADQSTPADMLTALGTWRPGDVFGGWCLNDLKAAVNLLVWTAAGNTAVTSLGHYGESPYPVPVSLTLSTAWTSKGEMNDRYAVSVAADGTITSALGSINAGPKLTLVGPGTTETGQVEPGGGQATFAFPQLASVPAGTISPAVDWYVDGEVVNSGRIDYGITFSPYASVGVGTLADPGPQAGSDDLPDKVPEAGIIYTAQSGAAMAILRWDVSGGFTYTDGSSSGPPPVTYVPPVYTGPTATPTPTPTTPTPTPTPTTPTPTPTTPTPTPTTPTPTPTTPTPTPTTPTPTPTPTPTTPTPTPTPTTPTPTPTTPTSTPTGTGGAYSDAYGDAFDT